jgi:hypothetical protein
MPERIQLSRPKGWRLPPNTVKVSRPGKWGNEFRIGDTVQRFSTENICETITVTDAAVAVALYRERMELALKQHPATMRPALDELRGRNLACWCKPGQPCHADVLLEMANR